MKTQFPCPHPLTLRHLPAGIRLIGLGLLVLITSSELLFASDPKRATGSESTQAETMFELPPGMIGVVALEHPAQWSYDAPAGQICSPGEAAQDAAVVAIELPAVSERGDVLLSVIGVVAAPFVAAGSGIQAARSRLPAATLSEVEVGLVHALSNVAQPQILAMTIGNLSPAPNGFSRRFVFLDIPRTRGDPAQPISTLLETEVTQVRLERQTSRDTSYTLSLEARVRLFRTADHALVYDSTFTYQTPPALFLDWALNQGKPLEQCARTGYRRIAAEVIADLERRADIAPVLVGAIPRHNSSSRRPGRAVITQAIHAVPPVATRQLASTGMNPSGPIYVVPSAEHDFFHLQRPLTRNEAQKQAISELDQAGLEAMAHPNFLVTLGGVAVITPLALYHQTIGPLFHGVSKSELRATAQPMTEAIANLHSAPLLATCLAQQLEVSNFHEVAVLAPNSASGLQLARNPHRPAQVIPASITAANSGGTLIQIEIVRAALQGSNSSNPKLAVCLTARVNLIDPADGSLRHSCLARYQGEGRKFKEWAADDAQLFRAELDQAYGQLSRSVLDEMLSRNWLVPESRPPTIASANP